MINLSLVRRIVYSLLLLVFLVGGSSAYAGTGSNNDSLENDRAARQEVQEQITEGTDDEASENLDSSETTQGQSPRPSGGGASESQVTYDSFTNFPGFGRISNLCQLTTALWFLGFAVLFLSVIGSVLYGGFLYTSAGVNAAQVNQAKGIIQNAFIGLGLGLSVFIILQTIDPNLLGGTCEIESIDPFSYSAPTTSSGGVITVTAGSFASGLYTGPAATIGSGSAYHIDTKFPTSISWEQIDQYFLAMAQGYALNNRRIEFSNRAVSGQVYNPQDPPATRIAMLQRAAAAHAPRPGNHSFDYYVPLNGTDRWSESVRDVEMILPVVPGGRADYASGGRYGNYVRVYDANGTFIYTTGHGNDTRPVPANKTF